MVGQSYLVSSCAMRETFFQSVVFGVTQIDKVPSSPASGGVPKAMKMVTSAEKF